MIVFYYPTQRLRLKRITSVWESIQNVRIVILFTKRLAQKTRL